MSDEKKTREELIAELEIARKELAESRARTEQTQTGLHDLERSQELTRRLIEAMPGGVVHVAIDGAIKTANAEALRVLGLSFDELTNKYTVEFETETVFEDGSPCPVEAYPVTKALMTGEAQPPTTIGVRKPDGELSWAVFTAVPVKGDDGGTTGAVVTFLDITARKDLEGQLRQSQKLEGIGRLAGGVAHDFNNLLTVILGNAQALEHSLEGGDSRLGDVEHIRHAAQHAATLTRQLLAFASKQVIAPRLVALDQLVDETAGMLRRIIGEHVELQIDTSADLWAVRLDPSQFEQVLINLAVNARDAMPDGGTLTIRTRNVEAGGAPTADEPLVELTVSDTGVGISADRIDHIFEPFYTNKEPGKGTGLGLATCYGIVTQAGGTLSVHSEEGQGATFSICLPRAQADRPPAPERAATGKAPGGTETVLLVEDEPLVRDMVERVLRRAGYSVLTARSGADALAIVDDHEGAVDLLLTDVVMPRMSGPEVAQKLREDRPELPVLYMSGYADDALGSHGIEASGVAFLRKPFKPDELAHKIREVLQSVA